MCVVLSVCCNIEEIGHLKCLLSVFMYVGQMLKIVCCVYVANVEDCVFVEDSGEEMEKTEMS